MEKLKIVTDKTFNNELETSRVPLLVEFWASWCPPCKMMEPLLEELSQTLANRVVVCKINVDQNPYTATAYTINGVPTIILFVNGREIRRATGAQSRKQIIILLSSAGILEETNIRSTQ